MKIPVNIIIFSQSATKYMIIKSLREIENDLKIICLSTHKLFDLEEKEFRLKSNRELKFLSFYNFINEKEMIWCDAEADKIILKEYGTRARNLGKYYEKIKELKNQVILQNLKKLYEFNDSLLLSSDLGIYSDIWLNEGFKNLESGYVKKDVIKTRNLLKSIPGAIKNILEFQNVYIMHTASTNFLFWGSSERIAQYLDDSVVMEKIGRVNTILLAIMFKTVSAPSFNEKNHLDKIIVKLSFLLTWCIYVLGNPKKKSLDFLSPIHEDNDNYGILAKHLGVKMFYMQDGYLPENYSSTYLRYRIWTTGYHVWDKLSAGIFKRHCLNWEKKDYFKSMRFPKQKERIIKVRSILVLTSGAGDWTALKNRSDEDLMFEAFVEVAKKFPDIKINYRPHPLWTHPTHQGVDSIKRVFDYASSLGFKNFIVSNEALKEGEEYNKDFCLSRKPKSVNKEIEEADIIFGDHSQAIINAGMKGKIFASVNLSRHTEFFYNYARLGFPLMKSADEIINFIKGIETSTRIIKKFNKSIDLYNNKYL